MREMIDLVSATWKQYWGENLLFIVLAGLSLLYILLSKEKENKKIFLGYFIIAGLLFACPVTAKLFSAMMGELVYWRTLWVLPFGILMAYAFAGLVTKCREKSLGFVVALILAAAIIFGGNCVYSSETFEKTHNAQKVPDMAAAVCEILKKEKTQEKPVRLLTTSWLATYIRVYDADILMPFGRRGDGIANGTDKKLYELMEQEVPDQDQVVTYARKNQWKYIAYYSRDPAIKEQFEQDGYEFLGQAEYYFVFKDSLE